MLQMFHNQKLKKISDTEYEEIDTDSSCGYKWKRNIEDVQLFLSKPIFTNTFYIQDIPYDVKFNSTTSVKDIIKTIEVDDTHHPSIQTVANLDMYTDLYTYETNEDKTITLYDVKKCTNIYVFFQLEHEDLTTNASIKRIENLPYDEQEGYNNLHVNIYLNKDRLAEVVELIKNGDQHKIKIGLKLMCYMSTSPVPETSLLVGPGGEVILSKISIESSDNKKISKNQTKTVKQLKNINTILKKHLEPEKSLYDLPTIEKPPFNDKAIIKTISIATIAIIAAIILHGVILS